MKKLVLISFVLILNTALNAQTIDRCHQVKAQEQFLLDHPEWVSLAEGNKRKLEDFTKNFVSQKNSNSCKYIVPIVFHILHDNGPENVSDQEIYETVERLNFDFNNLKGDTIDVVDEFKNLIGNPEIEFRLPTRDPNGSPTNGIVRYETQETYSAGESIKPGKQWPRNMYLNVYTARNIGGAAGYTFLPGSVGAGQDAILILYNYLGNSGTLTHEVGHWINLMHPWGWSNNPGIASNCNMDDQVQDTPLTVGWTSCNLSGTSCGSLDNVQNYMDYAFCDKMFTKGQSARMQAALNSTVSERNSLWSSSNLTATGVDQLTAADFSSDFTVICKNDFVQFFDASTYSQCDWSWAMNGGVPSSSTDKYPKSFYDTPGSYDVSLTVTGGGVSLTESKSAYVFVADPIGNYLPLQEGFETISNLSNSWGVLNTDNDAVKWEVTNNVAYSGTTSAVLNNFANTGVEIDQLISPGVDLSSFNSAAIEFKYAFAKTASSNSDILILKVSIDCGYSWNVAWAGSANTIASSADQTTAFVPVSQSDWGSKTVSLASPFLKEGFIYKFEFRGGGGNNVYLDDINITGTYKDEPVLYQPFDQSLVYSTDVKIDWKSIAGVDEYEYEVDVNPNFTSPLLVTGTKAYISANPLNTDTEELIPNLTVGQVYYWRVRAVIGTGTTNWSNVWEFTPAAEPLALESAPNSEGVNIYPNPTSGRLDISWADQSELKELTILNSIGQQLEYLNLQSNSKYSIDLSDFESGLYFLSYKLNGKREVRRIIKQ